MKQALIVTSSVIAVAFTALLAGSAAPAPRPPKSGEFSVDPVHSALVFRIRFANKSSFYARFNEISGSFAVDPSGDPASMRFDLKANAASVDTGNEKRDGHLRSPDFFSAKQYPEITFTSTKVEKTGDHAYDVTGKLTLRGITREAVAKVTYGGQSADPQFGGTRAGFDGTLVIQRKEFDVGKKFDAAMLGDEVTVMLGLTGISRD